MTSSWFFLSTYGLMLVLLIAAYAQFVKMLLELEKVLSQELSFCVAKLPSSHRNEHHQKLWMSVPYIFIALETNK